MDLSQVAEVAIYPAIGIARVGNSLDGHFLGPTIPGVPAQSPSEGKGPFRDAEGKIKRQAAEFRVFGLDKYGEVLGELTHSDAVQIQWAVEVANKKAAWYRFDIALDTEAAKGKYDTNGNRTPGGLPVLSQLRNRTILDREQLVIDGGKKYISGHSQKGPKFKGTIGGGPKAERKKVYLGEINTDEAGRLHFLGGLGHSASFRKPKSAPLTTFANNEGWHDDTSDGPVDATVTISDETGTRTLRALGAWVVTAPPDYAVGVQAFSTGYDLLEDVFRDKTQKERPAFYADIYPVLKYLSLNQWVNAGVSRDMGWGAGYDFEDKALIKRLKDPSDKERPLRQAIFQNFRNPDYQTMEPSAWPPLYGDALTLNIKSTDPQQWFAITGLKYQYLKQWAEGDFEVDKRIKKRKWDKMTPAEQAHGMTQAALEQTLGGPFHPGCEFTWPMRHRMMYEDGELFRIKRREEAREDYGVALCSEIALGKEGPLDGSAPGDITKWMAVPWQTDTSSCLSAYRAYSGEYLPTFWPARVPNDVLTEEDYAVLNGDGDANQKMEAFSPGNRKKWLRSFIYNDQGGFYYGTSIQDGIKGVTAFTHHWPEIGILTKAPVKDPGDLLPKEVWVETGRTYDPNATKKVEDIAREAEVLEASLKEITEAEQQITDWTQVNPRLLR